jgi:hypothetical protein
MMCGMDSLNSPHAGPVARGRIARLAAGLALAAVLTGGCSATGARLPGGARQPAHAAMASTDSAAGDQAVWNALLGGDPQSVGWIRTAALPGGQGHRRHMAGAFAHIHRCVADARSLRSSGHVAAARAKLHACFRGLLRLRLALLGAIHGQITVQTRKGIRTIAFERGTIKTVSAGSIVVVAPDGTTWTWSLLRAGPGGPRAGLGGESTTVVQARHRVGVSALAAGQRVLVLGRVVGGADDARLVVIRP